MNKSKYLLALIGFVFLSVAQADPSTRYECTSLQGKALILIANDVGARLSVDGSEQKLHSLYRTDSLLRRNYGCGDNTYVFESGLKLVAGWSSSGYKVVHQWKGVYLQQLNCRVR